MLPEPGAKDLFRLAELIEFPQFFSERKKEAALRIRFQAKPKLFDFWTGCRLSHGVRMTLPQKRTAPEGAARVHQELDCIIARNRSV